MNRFAIVAPLAVLAAMACAPRAERGADTDSARPSAGRREATRAGFSVQVAALRDSAAAARMRDSLAREGWTAGVARAQVQGATVWRVHILPTGDEALATLVAAALRNDGREALPSHEPPPGLLDSLGARVIVVNRRTHGMVARTRWLLAPDRRAMLVMEDPASVEADPLPNGVVYASEATGAAWQHDGVWDAAPSPDWSRLAYSQAYVVRGEREERIPPAEWSALAREIPARTRAELLGAGASEGELADALRDHSFPASGMTIMGGVAIAHVVPTASLAVREGTAPGDVAVRLGGWRMRWTRSGDTLAIGLAPRGTQDHVPSTAFVLALPRAGADSLATRDSSALAPLAWQEGPLLDISQAVDSRAARGFDAGDRRVESVGGWIRVRSRRGGGWAIVGPGMPLATTAGGRFIAALAPRPDADRHEAPTILVVYEVPQ